ncbi:MAG: DUF4249 domain-containing protein [Cytophagales bacterium]|nr:DUF4249 domain-containing protein [Cytophagales bacterium]
MKNRFYLILMVLAMTTLACQEIDEDFEFEPSEERLVVESVITDSTKAHWVQLSHTVPYNELRKRDAFVRDAEVSLSVDGASQTLTHVGNGLYLTDSTFTGEVGKEYVLTVVWRGDTYQARDVMYQSMSQVKTCYQFRNGMPPFSEDGYQLFVSGITNKVLGQPKYYRAKVFQNDTLLNYSPEHYIFFDDRSLADTLIGDRTQRLPFTFQPGTLVRTELYSLSADMYRYYVGLTNVILNDGGFFSPPPQNPETNVRNITNPRKEAFGYFQASVLISHEFIIAETALEGELVCP